MRIRKPVNGLVSVVDQSRCGILLFNEDGLYVDTVFLDGRKFSPKTAGLYPLPGEFFVGDLFSDRASSKIYFAMGKDTPLLFEAEGWSLKENPVRPLTIAQPRVTITASQIAAPPEIALSVRGGAGTAKLARFTPALGSVATDGSMSGWESSMPVQFQADKDQTVEVRCLYQPDKLLLRWHARLPAKFAPKPLPPLARVFTHDQLADTLSFYIQGDANAKPGGPPEGRAGDVRFVFGVFRDGSEVHPVAVGMYPQWTGPTRPSPQTYRTPVGTATFAHVGRVEGAELSYKTDEDGKGFVLVTTIPRAAIPALQQPFAGGLRHAGELRSDFRRPQQILVGQQRQLRQPRNLRRADRSPALSWIVGPCRLSGTGRRRRGPQLAGVRPLRRTRGGTIQLESQRPHAGLQEGSKASRARTL